MAFQKKTWKDRITEFPTRRTLTKSDGSTELVTVARAEGTVSQEGDAFNAASMNDLEERINQANNDLNESLKDGLKMTEDERKMLEYIYKANGGSNIETDMKVVKYIGQGTSFNIKTLYPASYQNFTADNFFCEPISSNSGSTSPDTHGYEGSSFYANYSFNKTYNANTGVLSVTSIVNFNINFAQYGYLHSNQQQVKAYIVL